VDRPQASAARGCRGTCSARIPGRRATPFEEDRGQAPVAVFQLRPGRRAPERAINGVFIFPTTNPNRARHLRCLGSISRCSAALSDHLIYRLPPLGTWPSASGTSIYIGIRNSYRGWYATGRRGWYAVWSCHLSADNPGERERRGEKEVRREEWYSGRTKRERWLSRLKISRMKSVGHYERSSRGTY